MQGGRIPSKPVNSRDMWHSRRLSPLFGAKEGEISRPDSRQHLCCLVLRGEIKPLWPQALSVSISCPHSALHYTFHDFEKSFISNFHTRSCCSNKEAVCWGPFLNHLSWSTMTRGALSTIPHDLVLCVYLSFWDMASWIPNGGERTSYTKPLWNNW